MNLRALIAAACEGVLDAVLPPRERSARTKARRAEDIPLEPASHELLGKRVATLVDYRRAEAQDLIRALKYDRSAHAARIAAQLLADYLREELASLHIFSAKSVLLVPVPLHKRRLAERGYNQIELVLAALPREFKDGTHSRLVPDALARIRATPPQTKLKRQERINNIAGAFACPNPALAAGAHVFLIDDVTTTGATLGSAAEPLERAGAEVTLLALARA